MQQDIAVESSDKPVVYLAGPMKELDDYGGAWRKSIENNYSDLFSFLNPFENVNPATDNVVYDPQDTRHIPSDSIFPSEYISDNKEMIRNSDAVFVGLQNVISRGTSMEILYAYEVADVPCYTWLVDRQTESGWVYHHSEVAHADLAFVIESMEEDL